MRYTAPTRKTITPDTSPMVGPTIGVRPEMAGVSAAGKKVSKPVVGCMSKTVAIVRANNKVVVGEKTVTPVPGEIRFVNRYKRPSMAHRMPFIIAAYGLLKSVVESTGCRRKSNGIHIVAMMVLTPGVMSTMEAPARERSTITPKVMAPTPTPSRPAKRTISKAIKTIPTVIKGVPAHGVRRPKKTKVRPIKYTETDVLSWNIMKNSNKATTMRTMGEATVVTSATPSKPPATRPIT
jgi:hypothetical protein